MFAWPRFAQHLHGVRPARERLSSMLTDLAGQETTARARDVLADFFESAALVQAMEHLAPRVHHVGLVAPAGADVAAIEDLVRASPFRDQVRRFRSTVLAKDLSARLGREIDVMVVWGSLPEPPGRCPAVEVFVADVPSEELDALVARETGCHMALALDSVDSLERARTALHASGHREIPLMRDGPLANREIRSSVLYIDVAGPERTRRLELIVSEESFGGR